MGEPLKIQKHVWRFSGGNRRERTSPFFSFMEDSFMKNKLLKSGIAALVLVLEMVAVVGCDNPTEVEGTVSVNTPAAPAPGKPVAVPDVSPSGSGPAYSRGFVVTWTAASDGIYYELFVREEGKTTISSLALSGNSGVSYTSSTSSTTYTGNPDGWAAKGNVTTSATGIQAGNKVRIGVRTEPVDYASNPSQIVWSEPVTF
jgi:hypothetical protein